MGTHFRHTSTLMARVGSTRNVTVTTAAAQEVVVGTTGAIAVDVMCLGPTEVSYGDSAITATSGQVLFPYASQRFSPISDPFSLFFRATSAASVISWTDLLAT